ncbi:ROK family protein [Brevibacillus sp. B_LB10_24]|uniref:ROK family protein n=1 Tax=Brevibacillus sp. B_LB10_24 TaxID=3380645 RepID=UPI0038B75EBA
MYEISPGLYYVIGIDLSRTHMKIMLMDLHLRPVEETRIQVSRESTPLFTLQFLEKSIRAMLTKHGLSTLQLLGIGIGAVGPLKREEGMILNPHNFPAAGWENIPISQQLGEAFQTKVFLDNGANTAVLGEYRDGLWKEAANVVYSIAGVGIRCGVMTHGQVVRGSANREGAFGHMVVDVHGRKCTCGHYGCLEAYGTIPAIRNEIIRQLKRGARSLLSDIAPDFEEMQFQHICQAIGEGDELSSQVVMDAGFHYGIGLSNMIHLIHPNMVILGGALFTELDMFYQAATDTARQRCNLSAANEVKFSRGSLGENAVAVGAGCMVIDYYLE